MYMYLRGHMVCMYVYGMNVYIYGSMNADMYLYTYIMYLYSCIHLCMCMFACVYYVCDGINIHASVYI